MFLVRRGAFGVYSSSRSKRRRRRRREENKNYIFV
jgi:hypothetical protein